MKYLTHLFGLAVLLIQPTFAETFVRPPADVDLFGEIRNANATKNDTLLDIGRRYDIGQDEIVYANPDVDRWLPGDGASVVIPSRYIIPRGKREGVILNVPEMRLYYFPLPDKDKTAELVTYPVSVGRMDWATPLGITKLASKTLHPSWRPPASIRAEAEANGNPLPEIVPAGPDNPLGDHALRLALPGYLLHGTNKPYGVGMRVSHGCLRMYPEDIAELFPNIPVGTTVNIVNQPVKIGWLLDSLYIEVHPALEEDTLAREKLIETAMDLVNEAWLNRPLKLDGQALKKALKQKSGIPVRIGHAIPG